MPTLKDVTSGDIIKGTLVKVDFFSVDNFKGLAGDAIKSGLTNLVTSIGQKLLQHALGIKSDQELIMEELGKINERLDQIDNYLRAANRSTQITTYKAQASEVANLCEGLKKELETRDLTPTAAGQLDAFSSTLPISWWKHAGALSTALTGGEHKDKYLDSLTNSALKAYSTYLIEISAPLQDYTSLIEGLLLHYLRLMIELSAIAAVSARFLQKKGHLSDTEADRRVANICEMMNEEFNKVANHARALTQPVFELHQAVFAKGEPLLCHIVFSPFGAPLTDISFRDVDGSYHRFAGLNRERGLSEKTMWELVPIQDTHEVNIRPARKDNEAYVRMGPRPTPLRWVSDANNCTVIDNSTAGRKFTLCVANPPYVILRVENGNVLAWTVAKNKDLSNVAFADYPPRHDNTHTHWHIVPALTQSSLHGHPSGGLSWDDLTALPHIERLSGARVWTVGSGGDVQALQFRYRLRDGSDAWAPVRGSSGGVQAGEILFTDRQLVKVSGRAATSLGRIVFGFTDGKSTEYGSMAGSDFTITVPAGAKIVAMRGRAGAVIDALGVTFDTHATAPAKALK